MRQLPIPSRSPVPPNRRFNSMPQLLAALLIMLTGAPAIASGPDGTEAARVTQRLLAAPRITTVPGFSARLVVPPGELYDPLQMVPSGDQVLVNDDGGEETRAADAWLRLTRWER